MLLALTSSIEAQTVVCGANGIQCQSDNTYQLCITVIGQGRLVGDVSICPSGTVCSETGSVL